MNTSIVFVDRNEFKWRTNGGYYFSLRKMLINITHLRSDLLRDHDKCATKAPI